MVFLGKGGGSLSHPKHCNFLILRGTKVGTVSDTIKRTIDNKYDWILLCQCVMSCGLHEKKGNIPQVGLGYVKNLC